MADRENDLETSGENPHADKPRAAPVGSPECADAPAGEIPTPTMTPVPSEPPSYLPPPPTTAPVGEIDRTRHVLALFLGLLVLLALTFLNSCERRKLDTLQSDYAKLLAKNTARLGSPPELLGEETMGLSPEQRAEENRIRRQLRREYFDQRYYIETRWRDREERRQLLRAQIDIVQAGLGSMSAWAFPIKAFGVVLAIWGLTGLYRRGSLRDRPVLLAALVILSVLILRQNAQDLEPTAPGIRDTGLYR